VKTNERRIFAANLKKLSIIGAWPPRAIFHTKSASAHSPALRTARHM
jgi:hypothetical protein